MTPAEQIKESILDLQTRLLANHPTIPVLLRTIHQHLQADPEVVTLLSEEEIGILVSGLKRQTNTEISAKVMKMSSKKLSQVSVDDL